MDFAVPANHRVKLKENEKKDKYLDLARENERDVYTICNCYSWYSHQRINKGTGGLGNKRTIRDNQNYCISEIDQNTEKSPGDLRKPTVTQTSMKDNQRSQM